MSPALISLHLTIVYSVHSPDKAFQWQNNKKAKLIELNEVVYNWTEGERMH